jgi:hypothetical protein
MGLSQRALVDVTGALRPGDRVNAIVAGPELLSVA